MSFQCYTSRASLRSALIGGLFISADGARRVVPDHYLTQAELLPGARLLRLSYTFCTIEVAGQCLELIFEDASIGKLGAIQVASPKEEPGRQTWVTSIVIMAGPQPAVSAFEEEFSNA
jgi:hypothetical protein